MTRKPQAIHTSIMCQERSSRCKLLAFVYVAMNFAFGACRDSKAIDPSDDRYFGPPHPHPENLLRPLPVTSTVLKGAKSDTNGPPFVSELSTVKLLRAIGVLEGEEDYVLGRIKAVAVGDGGKIIILDAGVGKVRVYTSDGKHLISFGRIGRGPGEFQELLDLRVIQDTVVVLDRVSLHTFALKEQEVRHISTVRLRGEPIQVCTMGARTFVHTVREDVPTLVFELSQPQRRFGSVYQGLSPTAAVHLNQSLIACNDRTNRIVLAPVSVLGELHAYDVNGQPAWIVKIDEFMPVDFRESPSGGSRTIIPEKGYDRFTSLISTDEGVLVAQIQYVSREDYLRRDREYTLQYTFAIDVRSGQAWSVGSHLPSIAAINRRILVSYVQEPFPQVRIYEW